MIEDDDNGFNSRWKGFNWTYEYPNNIDFTDLNNLTVTQVKFTIGQLEKNGKIYMQIKERLITNGIKGDDIQLPILF